MKFIKLEYIDEAIELINLSKVNVVKIGENYISFTTIEKEILVFKNENSFGAIKNFEEVKEKLLRLCDDWYEC